MSRHSTDRFWDTFPLRELFEEVCQDRYVLASRRRRIETIVDIPSNQCITADRELLRRAVRNLVLNALDAMPEGGSLMAISAAGPDVLELEIADTGSALSDRERREAFAMSKVERSRAYVVTMPSALHGPPTDAGANEHH